MVNDIISLDGIRKKALKKIWIVTVGSRGDVQPYVAVGAALVKNGYNVTLLTFSGYSGFVEAFGIRFVALCDDIDEQANKDPKALESLFEGHTTGIIKTLTNMLDDRVPIMCQSFIQEIKNNGIPDLCLASPLSIYFGMYLEDQHNVPYLCLRPQFAVSDNPDRGIFGLPKLPFGLDFLLLRILILPLTFKKSAKKYDKILQVNVLDRYSNKYLMAQYKNPTKPVLIMLSPEIAKSLYSRDCNHRYRKFVGCTILKQSQQLDQRHEFFGGKEIYETLTSFINNSDETTTEKPIYLGWGSMMVKSPQYFTEFVVRAVHHANQRAVVLCGRSGISAEMLDKTNLEPELIEYANKKILFVQRAPHEWLFKQMKVTVHHGGAGTTTAAVRAGVPTIITPVLLDQYDFSYFVRARQIGYGFKKQLHKITWQELGDVLKEVVQDDGAAKRAAELGAKLQKEDGAKTTVREIENFWNTQVVTGEYFNHLPPREVIKEHKNEHVRTIRAKLPLVTLVGVVAILCWNSMFP